ncbi:MAG: Mu transposase C-terminal domain-containing protein [Ruminococcus bromii]|nr:Mu transposase C-terminal domain-containing protein [Ruminococcus bromii]
MIYLTAKEVAGIKGCSERYVKMLINNGSLQGDETINKNNRKKYLIPLSELSTAEQLKYYKSNNIEIPDELLAGRKPKAQHQHKEFDEFSAAQREEIAEWIRILNAWDEYCAKSTLKKVAATEKFVQLQKVANPDINISKGILYRKKKALKADDLAGLIDNRGSWKRGTSSIQDVVWECFLYFYLDEAQHSIQACIDYTRMWIEKAAPQYLPLPDYSSFYRKVQNSIPKQLEIMGREGMKAFQDRCGTYIRRTYESMFSNEWWIADNHTFDVQTKGKNGSIHRLYLTAFFDARSGIFTGCYVTDAPSSQSTLLALRKGIQKYGIPQNIYVDNGREFLTFDVGGLGHRLKKSQRDRFAPPPVLERLGIKMTNAIVRNAKAKIIERRFRDVKERLSKLFNTYTGGNVVERPERLKKVVKNLDNIPTDENFTNAVEDILQYYFNEQQYSGAVSGDSGKTRMQVYKDNLHEKRIASEYDLNLMLMRSTRSQKVGRRGVHITVAGEQIDYFNDELKANYFGQSVYCRYDPENMSTVRVYDLNDNYLMTVPADNEAVREYGASKDELAAAIRKTKSFEKLTAQQLRATAITSLGKETALELVLATAEANKANAEEYQPKVISVHRADEPSNIQMAVGQNNIVKIDKAKMIRNLEQRQNNEEE